MQRICDWAEIVGVQMDNQLQQLTQTNGISIQCHFLQEPELIELRRDDLFCMHSGLIKPLTILIEI